jgi:Putative zinc dependent peptidase (DUF5700)
MRAGFALVISAALASPTHSAVAAEAGSRERIQLEVDTSEAEAVLAALDAKNAGASPGDLAWQRIFSSEPYLRLKKREASLHRDFTDDDFRKFVLSEDLARRTPALRHTLDAWAREDLVAAARRVLPYLPEEASIRARVFLVIKPLTNSFVFEVSTDPAIFLYLDPEVTAAKFANTVAHELHHIGYASVTPRTNGSEGLSPGVQKAVDWMGAFGEGFAMLAAAGSPDVHPHAVSPRKDRARWDRDMENVGKDLKTLERFFLDVIEGRLKTEEEISERAFSFFGIQGPWYTVGYKMAVVIEKREGRAKLIECMSDPRRLLATYNRVASELNAKEKQQFALWSPDLLSRIGAEVLPKKAPTGS